MTGQGESGDAMEHVTKPIKRERQNDMSLTAVPSIRYITSYNKIILYAYKLL